MWECKSIALYFKLWNPLYRTIGLLRLSSCVTTMSAIGRIYVRHVIFVPREIGFKRRADAMEVSC